MVQAEAAILVGIGGLLGANARYLVSVWAARRIGPDFPYGTLIVNLSGSVLLGFLVTVIAGLAAYEREVQLLVPLGFVGAYTTFSTFAYESVGLVRRRAYGLAVTNVLGSTMLGLLGAWLGIAVARAI
ncbi:MAG: fluoride efflux transporter CrcB [Chloroflexi bacterium]|nr:fluoride efflux transporter CrcB [Chloroflexota bacterium]